MANTPRRPRAPILRAVVRLDSQGSALPCYVQEWLACGHPGAIVYRATLPRPQGQRRCGACEDQETADASTPQAP
jgi:hypothetical protein